MPDIVDFTLAAGYFCFRFPIFVSFVLSLPHHTAGGGPTAEFWVGEEVLWSCMPLLPSAVPGHASDLGFPTFSALPQGVAGPLSGWALGRCVVSRPSHMAL